MPALHIVRAFNASEYRFYELSGDLEDALHFNHFEKPAYETPLKLSGRIKLGEKVVLKSRPKIKLHDPDVKISTPVEKEEKITIKVKDKKSS